MDKTTELPPAESLPNPHCQGELPDGWVGLDKVPEPTEQLANSPISREELARFHQLAVRITWTPEERAEVDRALREFLNGQFGYDG